MGGVNTGGQALRTAFAAGNLVGPGLPSIGNPALARLPVSPGQAGYHMERCYIVFFLLYDTFKRTISR